MVFTVKYALFDHTWFTLSSRSCLVVPFFSSPPLKFIWSWCVDTGLAELLPSFDIVFAPSARVFYEINFSWNWCFSVVYTIEYFQCDVLTLLIAVMLGALVSFVTENCKSQLSVLC